MRLWDFLHPMTCHSSRRPGVSRQDWAGTRRAGRLPAEQFLVEGFHVPLQALELRDGDGVDPEGNAADEDEDRGERGQHQQPSFLEVDVADPVADPG